MSALDPRTRAAWQLVEELYLETMDEPAQRVYAGLDETERRAILAEFVRQRARASGRWDQIRRDLESADLSG